MGGERRLHRRTRTHGRRPDRPPRQTYTARFVPLREAFKRIRRVFVGESRDPLDPQVFHQISLAAYGFYDGIAPYSGPIGLLSTFPANTTTIEGGLLGCGCRVSYDGDTRYAELEFRIPPKTIPRHLAAARLTSPLARIRVNAHLSKAGTRD